LPGAYVQFLRFSGTTMTDLPADQSEIDGDLGTLVEQLHARVKTGVGKTALVSHLAWMYADLEVPVLAVDLDPQSNLSAMFLTEDRLRELWVGKQTIAAAVQAPFG